MNSFFRTVKYLLRAQLQSPLFYVLLATALACALLPLFSGGASAKAVVICDNDRSALSRELVAKATSDPAMKLAEVNAASLPFTLGQLRNGVVEAVFVINPGYGDSIQKGEYVGVVKLYLSPYSTSSRTFSDSFASLVMSQWSQSAASAEAEKQMGPAAGAEAARLYEQGFAPIMTVDVEGGAAQSPDSNDAASRARSSLFLLSALACFLVLCFSGGNEAERAAMLERFQSRGWSAAAYAFARPAVSALLPAAAALIPCVLLAAIGSPLAGLEAYLLFLFILFSWVGISTALNSLTRNPSVQLSFAAVLAILNAILSYPSGLLQSAGFVRFLLPGYWFTQAIGQGAAILPALPVVAVALGAVGVGILIANLYGLKNSK